MNDPLEPRLAQLLRRERDRPDPASSTRDRVLERVAATVAAPAPGATSNTPPASGSGFFVRGALLSIATAGAVGSLLVLRGMSPATPRVESAPHGAAIARESAPVPASPARPAPTAPVVETAPVTHAVPLPSGATNLATERALLDRARADLLAGEPAEALAVVGTHARRFPHGALSEERDAMRVEALAAAGRSDDARAAAAKFRAAYPDSVLTAAVTGALDAIP